MDFTKINKKLEELDFVPSNKFYFMCIINEIETNNGIISRADMVKKYGLCVQRFRDCVKEYIDLGLIHKEIININGQKYSKYFQKI